MNLTSNLLLAPFHFKTHLTQLPLTLDLSESDEFGE